MAEPRFRFRASVVLELRRRRDAAAQDALKAADLAVLAAEQALRRARDEVAAGAERPRQAGGDDQWYRNWMVGLRAAVAAGSENLALRKRAREEALAAALVARRDLRVIQRLYERQRRAFEVESTRRDQRRLDDLAVQRHEAGRRARGGSS
jgi:flagellar export protein FliJ